MKKSITYIAISAIEPNPHNPRKSFNDEALKELASSISQLGVLQPITVRTVNEGYQIVCGERRWRASKLAGVTTIPAVIRKLTDDEAMDIAITENLQRKDVSPIEEAQAFEYLSGKGQGVNDISIRFGKCETYIRTRLRLLSLIEPFMKMLESGDISISQAMEIVKFDEPVQQGVFDSHFNNVSPYYDWSKLNAKALYKEISRGYSHELDQGKFDQSECYECQFNSDVATLFPEGKARCLKPACFGAKRVSAIALEAQRLLALFPSAQLYYDGQISTPAEILSENGYTLESVDSRKYSYLQEDFTDDLSRDPMEADIIVGNLGARLIMIEAKPNSGAVAFEKRKSQIADLRGQEKRYAEIVVERTAEEICQLAKGLDLFSLKDSIPSFERNLVLFALARKLTHEQQKKLGLSMRYTCVGEEDLWSLICEATATPTSAKRWVVDFIYRCTIVNNFTCGAPDGFITGKLFEWIESVGAIKVSEVKQRHHEVYLRRKEKIDAKIAAIELQKD